ncbi:amidase [Pseudomonas sp. 22526]|uniref:amidase n=1 Tax=Pseudomonas sp. 22526 TaxID=3453937 RepID=UPI003F82EF74
MTPLITRLTAVELMTLIQARDLSPVEVTEAFLERILDTRTSSNAFVDIYECQARAAAHRACKAISSGQASSSLHGMPIALKDLFHVKGELTTAGSLCWKQRRAQTTSTVVERLLSKGIVILGKTHTVEFGLGAFGVNEHFATPRNPWSRQTELAPGGSSSGSAVAVATGLTPWALGTDTGGSVRIPASWCGIVGLKPSHGQIEMTDVVPLSQTLDSVGVLARSVEDASLLYAHLLDEPPRQCLADNVEGFGQVALSRYRVATLPLHERSWVSADVLACYDTAVAVLRDAGIQTRAGEFPMPLEEYLRKNSLITFYEALANYRTLHAEAQSGLGESVRARLSRGAGISQAEYLNALQEMARLRSLFERIYDQVEAIVLPTTQMPACAVDDIEHLAPPNHFTRFVNFLGLCAIAVPAGFTADNRPCSLQFVCKRNQEHIAIGLARAYEARTPWHSIHPPAFLLPG